MSDDDVIGRLESTFRDATHRQLETLRSILEHNAGVSYLQRYLGGGCATVDSATFRRALPLSSYDDYSDYIDKLADGVLCDDNGQPLLSVDPLVCFFYSSGTSSMKPKLIPCFDSKLGRTVSSLAHQYSAAALRRLFPPRSSSNKVLGFIYAGNVTRTKGGFMAMAATSFPIYYNSPNSSQFLSVYVSPKEVILGLDVNQQMYCHLLCGLRHFDSIDSIRAPYASSLIKALTLLETKWEDLSCDLDNGVPSSDITDISMRESVIEILGGSRPDVANRIRLICEEKSWDGIISKLWPSVRYIKCVTTGSMIQYHPKLKYYAGEVPILGGDYFASECCVAINTDISQSPESTRYTMIPNAAYFEFLAFDFDKSCVVNDQTVDISGVEVGKMYELVVTTFRGFYRLRLGDVVKVVGFYDQTPQVEFVMRAPKTSSGEIVTEKDLLTAVGSFQNALKGHLAVEIVEFACAMDLGLEPKQLKIFIEFKEKSSVSCEDSNNEELVDVVRKFCSVLEDNMGSMYRVMKARGEVSSLSISVVKCGTFDDVLQQIIKNGAPPSQYKPPKIVRNRQVVDYLEMSTVIIM